MNTKMKKKTLLNTSIERLKKVIKTEMAIVHVTTNNKIFLSLQEAIKEQEKIQKKSQIVKKKREKIMKVYEILSKVLSENEWGIFFKGEPIEGYPTQDGMKMYKVNEVASDRLYDAIEKEIIQTENQCQQAKTSSEEEQTESK
jgi:hypothetical protein